ncbi:hypothetical protein SteCoe_17178 [Stentor coeruleus]|uniref:EF-hand domain-containing protein n=1 Tax=Stentor coeruleus TaxID=5963 RepID=A0A1R2BZV8_9CILI|nr:hypothetical protein SteCoe_17178 [Stentor coeruleus]
MSQSSLNIQNAEELTNCISEKLESKKTPIIDLSQLLETQNPPTLNVSSPLNSSKRFKNSNKKSVVDDFNVPKTIAIPTVDKDANSSETFDLEFLLNSDVQKIPKSCHRMTQSTTIPSSSYYIKTKDHVKKSIQYHHSRFNSMSSKDLKSEFTLLKSKRPSIDIDERFYSKAKKNEEKVKTLKEQKDMEEILSCTFKPQIMTKRKQKSYEEFYECATNFKDKKDKKAKIMKEEEEKAFEKTAELSYKPKLCEKSLQIVTRKSAIDEDSNKKVNKFYRGKGSSVGRKERVSVPVRSSSKIPQAKNIKKSQNGHRAEPIDKYLYNDTLKRKNAEPKKTPQQTPKFITANSEKVLISKLKREFEENFFIADIDSTGRINYTRMIELFKNLSLIKNDSKREEERLLLLESWKLLSSNNKTINNKHSILCFILAVMNFYEDWMSQSDEDRLFLSLAESKKLHKKYELFYKNRSQPFKNPSLNKSLKENDDYSFHPQIGAISEHLYEHSKSSRNNGKIEDHLISEKSRIYKKIEEKRILIEELDMEECSFNPVIEAMPESSKTARNYEKDDLATEYFKQLNTPENDNKHKGLLLHDLSKIYKTKRQFIITNEKEKSCKKELDFCNFTPYIAKRSMTGENFPSSMKKSEKNQRKKPEAKKKIKLISTKKKINDVQAEENREILETEEFKEEDQKEFFRVISIIDGVATISLNLEHFCETLQFNLENDDPASTVMDFSARYCLKKEKEYKLVKKLTLLKYTN